MNLDANCKTHQLFRLKLCEVQTKCLSPGDKMTIGPHKDGNDGTKTAFFF